MPNTDATSSLPAASGSDDGEPVTDALRRMLRSPEEELRRRAITSLVNRGDQGCFSILQERLERGNPPEGEADALGMAMARLEPERARALFAKWVTPKGMIGRFMALPGQRIQWWGAVSGLALLPGEVEPLIRGLFDRVDEDLRQHCVAVLVRRRKRQLGAT
jgi:HEAT repeat protein